MAYPTPVRTSGLTVTFNVELGGGTGGDGMTFALLDPAKSTATSVGNSGNMLGLGGIGGAGGLPGGGIMLGTEAAPTWPGSNFIALTKRTLNGELRVEVGARGIGPLRSGTHTVRVQVVHGDDVLVWLDGAEVLQAAEPTLTPTSRLIFTGSTGGLTDLHLVRDVAIAAGG